MPCLKKGTTKGSLMRILIFEYVCLGGGRVVVIHLVLLYIGANHCKSMLDIGLRSIFSCGYLYCCFYKGTLLWLMTELCKISFLWGFFCALYLCECSDLKCQIITRAGNAQLCFQTIAAGLEKQSLLLAHSPIDFCLLSSGFRKLLDLK